MEHPRKYGPPPYSVALLHGGPGAAGSLEPIARRLGERIGTLEPWQKALSVEGQVEETIFLLKEYGHPPISLLGHSWGAMLALIIAARYPTLIEKLILIGTPPLKKHGAGEIHFRRQSRMSPDELQLFEELMRGLKSSRGNKRNEIFARFGELMTKIDSVDLIPGSPPAIEYRYDIFESIWNETAARRKAGEFLALIRDIECPIIAIHGAADPHPRRGFADLLKARSAVFRLHMLPDCGHYPWLEKAARDQFFRLLEGELFTESYPPG